MKNYKVLQTIETAGQVIIICDHKIWTFAQGEISRLPRRGEIMSVEGELIPSKVLVAGVVVLSRTAEEIKKLANERIKQLNREAAVAVYEQNKPDLDKKFAELPEIFQDRIKMMRFNVPDFDVLYAYKQINQCYEAYQLSKQNHVPDRDNGKCVFKTRYPSFIQRLVYAYKYGDIVHLEQSDVMLLVDDDCRIAMPRLKCIQRYQQSIWDSMTNT